MGGLQAAVPRARAEAAAGQSYQKQKGPMGRALGSQMWAQMWPWPIPVGGDGLQACLRLGPGWGRAGARLGL